MIESDYLYEQATESSNLATHIAALPDDELRKLRGHAEHIIKRNGKSGGIPALIAGACVMEAANRFQNQK